MMDLEVALELLKLVLRADASAALDKQKILSLYRECLDAVRAKPE